MIIPLIIWVAIAFVALVILLWFFPVTLWFQAILSGVHIPLIQLVLMRWRGVNPNTIVIAMITGTKAGLKLKANELEAHYLAKGNVVKVVNALISADKANIALDFKTAAGIDLAGRDVFEAVQMSVNPKVINTPPVTAVAKNGIQLICKARVTESSHLSVPQKATQKFSKSRSQSQKSFWARDLTQVPHSKSFPSTSLTLT